MARAPSAATVALIEQLAAESAARQAATRAKRAAAMQGRAATPPPAAVASPSPAVAPAVASSAPIAMPPSRAGLSPSRAMAYATGAGMGGVGLGIGIGANSGGSPQSSPIGYPPNEIRPNAGIGEEERLNPGLRIPNSSPLPMKSPELLSANETRPNAGLAESPDINPAGNIGPGVSQLEDPGIRERAHPKIRTPHPARHAQAKVSRSPEDAGYTADDLNAISLTKARAGDPMSAMERSAVKGAATSAKSLLGYAHGGLVPGARSNNSGRVGKISSYLKGK